MKKLQITSATIISILLTSNIILVNQYKHDVKGYEHKIKSQSKIIKTNQQEKHNLVDSLRSKTMEVHNLREKMNQVDRENKQLKERLNNLFHYQVTAYSPYYESTGKTSKDADYKITTSGDRVQQGTTIACPPSLDFGTKLLIQNVGLRVCQDRGAAIKQGRIDLYFDSVQKALVFGKQKLLVEVLN